MATKPKSVLSQGGSSPSDKVVARINAFIRSLPLEVKDSDELSWVYNHPAMLRKGEERSNMLVVQIDINDLKRPPHGPAPSQRAVQLLRYWCQNPTEFFKQQLDTQKKRAHAEDDVDDEDELEFSRRFFYCRENDSGSDQEYPSCQRKVRLVRRHEAEL